MNISEISIEKRVFGPGIVISGVRSLKFVRMMGKNMPSGMVVCLPRVKMCFLTFWVENVENRWISLHFRRCGHEPGADLGGRKNQNVLISSETRKTSRNDWTWSESVWEYHLGVRTGILCDLGSTGRYSGVLEGNFHVDSQNPKVGYGGELFKYFHFCFLKSHKIYRNDWK